MTIKKINLSALNSTNSSTDTTETGVSSFSDGNIVSQTAGETKNENIQESGNKTKISLKTLKKCSINTKGEEKCDEVVIEDEKSKQQSIETSEVLSKTSKISLKKTISEQVKESEILEKNDTNTSIIDLKAEKNEEPQKIETFQISDGDTSCNIIKEEKSEIFANYKGSFSHSEEEVKNEVIKEIIESKPEIMEVKNEPKAEIIEKKEEEIIQESSKKIEPKSEKTNLERYSESEILAKKMKQKRIVVGSIVGLLSISIPGVFIAQNTFLKSNVNEVSTAIVESTPVVENNETSVIENTNNTQITTTEEVKAPEIIPVEMGTEITGEAQIIQETNNTTSSDNTQEVNNIITETQTNQTEIVETQINPDLNNQILNNDIVKENNENQFENNEKTTKINEKLHNYLLEKYKK